MVISLALPETSVTWLPEIILGNSFPWDYRKVWPDLAQVACPPPPRTQLRRSNISCCPSFGVVHFKGCGYLGCKAWFFGFVTVYDHWDEAQICKAALPWMSEIRRLHEVLGISSMLSSMMHKLLQHNIPAQHLGCVQHFELRNLQVPRNFQHIELHGAQYPRNLPHFELGNPGISRTKSLEVPACKLRNPQNPENFKRLELHNAHSGKRFSGMRATPGNL